MSNKQFLEMRLKDLQKESKESTNLNHKEMIRLEIKEINQKLNSL